MSTWQLLEVCSRDAYPFLKRIGLYDFLYAPKLREQCKAGSVPISLPTWLRHAAPLDALGFNLIAQQVIWVQTQQGIILVIFLHGFYLADSSKAVLGLRWPLLLMMAMVGTAIGLFGCLQLTRRSKSTNNVAYKLWAFSFFWYTMMNVAAIPTHSLLVPDINNNPAFAFFLAMDIGSTAAACVEAIRAVYSQRTHHLASSSRWRAIAIKDFLPGLCTLAMSLTCTFLKVPWGNEVLYAAVVNATFVYIGAHLLQLPRKRSQQSKAGTRTAWSGLAMVCSAVFLDSLLCKTFGPQVNAAVVVFSGCIVIYAGLLMHLTAKDGIKVDHKD